MAVCGRGRGAEPGPTSVVVTPRGLCDAADTLRAGLPGCVFAEPPLPAAGRGRPAAAPHAPLLLGVRALFRLGPRLVPLERSRMSFQVPEAEQVMSFPVPREPPRRAAAVGGAVGKRHREKECKPRPDKGKGTPVPLA